MPLGTGDYLGMAMAGIEHGDLGRSGEDRPSVGRTKSSALLIGMMTRVSD